MGLQVEKSFYCVLEKSTFLLAAQTYDFERVFPAKPFDLQSRFNKHILQTFLRTLK